MITAEEFDKKFDDNEDIEAYIDWSKATRPNLEQKRVNLDLPMWMIDRLDREAKRLGVARQAIMKIFLAEKLEKLSS
ncbi:CopG family antitoxin [Hydrogenimonas sp. SS33]|uniref:type II toxin-antitoxin system BrnA family antitoxin n=1 Tax=Hydrogenimonas leucolamina TaxID=2954236 RepID=UPI00336C16C6